MSLGRLLRRASSKASDLLTLNASSSGGRLSSVLDGEIIYSKNNVCVHPPEMLQGIVEHHPGEDIAENPLEGSIGHCRVSRSVILNFCAMSLWCAMNGLCEYCRSLGKVVY